MKSLFDKANADEIIERIESLDTETKSEWGKMDVAQMLKHCADAMEIALGNNNPRRIFMGRILGPMLKPSYVGDKPFKKGSPTGPGLIVTGPQDFQHEKERLVTLVRKFNEGGIESATRHPHSFFGKLTPEQWGQTQYKHLDHHLKQFGK